MLKSPSYRIILIFIINSYEEDEDLPSYL